MDETARGRAMTPDEIADFGVEGHWPVLRRHAIRWSECDAYGHVNHVAYLTLCEDLRVADWLALGGDFAPDQPGPVVAQLEARYRHSIGFRDAVLLGMRPATLRRTSFVHDYAIWKHGVGLVFEARAVLVLVRGDSGERVPIPAAARALMLASRAKAET